MRALLFVSLCLFLVACGREPAASLEDFNARGITLPDGTVVKAEVMMHPQPTWRGA